ncbi:MAG: phage tail sheath family protein [Gemmatimonadaceae bacterium]|nr:phage tail sheath family protein [Chitinophagaceae bacterium]
MQEYKTPGVYIEEIPKLPPSVASVETAIPAFIGYTEKAQWKEEGDLKLKPRRITSLLEYEQYFGKPDPEKESISVTIKTSPALEVNVKIDETKRSKFLMHYCLQMFFANGGGPCWIISVEDYTTGGGIISSASLKGGLDEAEKINEITLLLFPDAINLTAATDYYDLYDTAIDQCRLLQDRFTVMDVYHSAENGDNWREDIALFRNTLAGTTDGLKYAAAYFPRIYTGVDYVTGSDETVKITGFAEAQDMATLKTVNNAYYFLAKNAISTAQMLLPPSSAVVGIYALVDRQKGVWKAPANVNIDNAIRPEILITNRDQESLNVDVQAGKSINVIRKFEGAGPALVWGARTLAGNDNEWRYINVRRFFIMVEESVKNASEQFVFESNDRNTWIRVKGMIDNYLTQLWRAGALMGTTEREAFFVHVGIGETMTEQDILEGRMIIEIGLAAVRPAEFIILRFMHKMMADS